MPWAAIIPAVASLAAAGISAASSSGAQSQAADQFQQNIANQHLMAQQGIQWKVNDAKAAGIHPLFALNANTASFSPVHSVGGGGMDMSALSNAGQHIGRAIEATSTKPSRENGVASALLMERASLENDLIRSQIARNLGQGQVGPPFPSMSAPTGGLAGQQIPGPASIGIAEAKPHEIVTSVPGNPGHSAGPMAPMVRWVASTDKGGAIPYPAKDLEGVDDGPIGIDWYVRNMLGPMVDSAGHGPTPAQIQSMWPGAIGARWNHGNWRWEPDFGRNGPRYIGASSRRGASVSMPYRPGRGYTQLGGRPY